MQYRLDKYGNPLSILGYGCMRLTQKGGHVDIEKAKKEIFAAYQAGINYFDTAYIYQGNEAALGEVLESLGIRDRINIATKLPHYYMRSLDAVEKCFQEELKRLRTDHIDYYLMHMLNDVKSWQRLLDMGIGEWLQEKKECGAIRQLGFSYHGNADMFCRLVDAYDWDLCLIQYNYLDEYAQAGRTGLVHAAQKGLPVMIMEPLRGGRLVNGLPERARKQIEAHPRGWTAAEWSFRWLWDQKEVCCVLSGMNSLEMIDENCRIADAAQVGSFTEGDRQLLSDVVKAIQEKMKVGCTGCGYCMPCPQMVDIPGTFSAYNKRYSDGWFVSLKEYMMCTLLRKDATSASNCIGCGKCERHCPQGIDIRNQLAAAKKILEDPVYQVARRVVPLIYKY